MVVGGLARLVRSGVGHAVARPERQIDDLATLLKKPAANDHLHLVPKPLEPDPIDFFSTALGLGEAAPAALFLFPVWAAALAYLKDPQYYLNKQRAVCGDPAQPRHDPFQNPNKQKGPQIEWEPFHHRLFPERPSYRDPNLSDAARRELIEILQPERRRGLEPGSVGGRPLVLPSDPPRTITSPLTWEPRNALWSAPRTGTMPETERALPNVQQEDVQRHLATGDHLSNRSTWIGDFADGKADQLGARDFLALTQLPAHQKVPLSVIPDIRMQQLGHKPAATSYSDRYRKLIQGGATPPDITQSPAPQPAPAPQSPQILPNEVHRQVLMGVFKTGPLTVRQVYGKTVVVNAKEVTLRSVLAEFWRLRREQMIAEKKLGADCDTDPLSEDTLDIVYFDLMHKLRPHSRWNKGQKRQKIPLQIPPGQFMPNGNSLEGTYQLLWLIFKNRSFMKDKSVFPFDKDGDVVFYNPQTGQHIQYLQLLKSAHAQIAKAIANRDFRVDAFGTYDRERPDPRSPVYGPNGLHVADRNKPYIERAVDLAVVTGKKEASYPNEMLRTRMWQWVQHYSGEFPRMTRPVIRRRSDPQHPQATAFHHEWPAPAGVYASEGMAGRGVGIQRDPYGARLGQMHLAMPDRNPLIARMSDAPRGTVPAIPPPPPGPAPVRDGDMLAAEANDLAARLAVLRRYSNRTRAAWDALAQQLEDEDGTLVDKLPRIRAFVDSEEKRIGETRLRQAPPEWKPEPVTISPYLYARLAGAYGDPSSHVTIADLSRAHNYYFGNMGGLPPGPSRRTVFKETGEVVYGNTVHRELAHLQPMNHVEMQAQLKVQMRAERASMKNFGGHWWALGMKYPRPDGKTIPSTLRLYQPIRPEHADEVMDAMTAMVSPYVRARRDVQYKLNQDPREWRGDDGNLAYTGRADYRQIWRQMRALEVQHPEWFHAPIGTPMVARLLDENGRPTNISIAQSPPAAEESVNGQVSSMGAKALQWYRLQRARNRQPSVDEAIHMVARRLKEEGRDLAHPAYLAVDQDTGLPGWITYLDVHVHTDQFFPEDVPLALEVATDELQHAATPAAAAAAQEIISTIHRRYPKGGR